MYIVLFLGGGMIISKVENIPLLTCLFETASLSAPWVLSLGITPALGAVSKTILMILMFFGRVRSDTDFSRRFPGRKFVETSGRKRLQWDDDAKEIRDEVCFINRVRQVWKNISR